MMGRRVHEWLGGASKCRCLCTRPFPIATAAMHKHEFQENFGLERLCKWLNLIAVYEMVYSIEFACKTENRST